VSTNELASEMRKALL